MGEERNQANEKHRTKRIKRKYGQNRRNNQKYLDTFSKQKKKKKKGIREKKKEINYRLIEDKAIIDIRTLFHQQQEKDYYKLKRASNSHNNNYIEYESNGDRNRNLTLDKHLNKINIT